MGSIVLVQKTNFLDHGQLSQTVNCEYEFVIILLVNSICTQMSGYLMVCLTVQPNYSYGDFLIEGYLNSLNICTDSVG